MVSFAIFPQAMLDRLKNATRFFYSGKNIEHDRVIRLYILPSAFPLLLNAKKEICDTIFKFADMTYQGI